MSKALEAAPDAITSPQYWPELVTSLSSDFYCYLQRGGEELVSRFNEVAFYGTRDKKFHSVSQRCIAMVEPIDRRPGEKTSKTIPGEIPSHAFRDHRYNRGRFFLSSAVSRAIDRSPRNRSFKSNTLTLEREREREKFVIFFFLSVSLFYPFFLARRNRWMANRREFSCDFFFFFSFLSLVCCINGEVVQILRLKRLVSNRREKSTIENRS